MQLVITPGAVRIPERRNANRVWSVRRSLRIDVSVPGAYNDDRRLCGMGESTPLPGFSPDSLDACEQWLRKLDLTGFEVVASEDPVTLLERLAPWVEAAPPAARFGVECSLLTLWARSRGQRLDRALCTYQPPAICETQPNCETRRSTDTGHPNERRRGSASSHRQSQIDPGQRQAPGSSELSCPLIDIWRADFLDSARTWFEQGARRLKIKIGRDLALEEQRLSALASAMPVLFRLDANQALDRSHFERTLEHLAHLPVEYVEEPVPLAALGCARPLALPLAFDESLLDLANNTRLLEWLNSGHTRAVVCKPMLLGGLLRVLHWRQLAHQAGTMLVLSHLFDGCLAMHMYRALALWLEPSVSHGLADHEALKLWCSAGKQA